MFASDFVVLVNVISNAIQLAELSNYVLANVSRFVTSEEQQDSVKFIWRLSTLNAPIVVEEEAGKSDFRKPSRQSIDLMAIQIEEFILDSDNGIASNSFGRIIKNLWECVCFERTFCNMI